MPNETPKIPLNTAEHDPDENIMANLDETDDIPTPEELNEIAKKRQERDTKEQEAKKRDQGRINQILEKLGLKKSA